MTQAVSRNLFRPAYSTAVARSPRSRLAFANARSGISLGLVNTISGVNSGVASCDLTGAADIESTDALRTRMLYTYANPPAGGSASDYVEWALQVPGVTRAWCLPNGAGSGTVVVLYDVGCQ